MSRTGWMDGKKEGKRTIFSALYKIPLWGFVCVFCGKGFLRWEKSSDFGRDSKATLIELN